MRHETATATGGDTENPTEVSLPPISHGMTAGVHHIPTIGLTRTILVGNPAIAHPRKAFPHISLTRRDRNIALDHELSTKISSADLTLKILKAAPDLDRSLGARPDMAGYHGGQDHHRQREWSEGMDAEPGYSGRRLNTGEFDESRSPAFQQQSTHANILPPGHARAPEHPDHHHRHDTPYAQVPLGHSPHGYGVAEESSEFPAEDARRAQYMYLLDNAARLNFYGTSRRSTTQDAEASHGRFPPRSSQDPDLGRGRFSNASESHNAFWNFTPAPPHYPQMQDGHAAPPPPYQQMQYGHTAPPLPYQHAHERRDAHSEFSTYEVEDTMFQQHRRLASGPHHNNLSAYEEAQQYARDHASPEDGRMMSTSHHHSRSEPALQLSSANEVEENRTKAWAFAVESFQKGEINALIDCGSPYLEQAARQLLQQVEAEQATRDSTPKFRSKTTSKPVPPRNICPFVESDAENEEHEQDHKPVTDTCVLKPEHSSSGAAQSQLLRDRARQGHPPRPLTAASDNDLASLFEEPDSATDSTLFVQKTVAPEKKAAAQARPAGAQHQNGHEELKNASVRNDQSNPLTDSDAKPTTNSDSDPFPKPASASQASTASAPKMDRAEMARIMAERNRQKELSKSSTPQPVKAQAAGAPAPFDGAQLAKMWAELSRQKEIYCRSMAPPPKPGTVTQNPTPQADNKAQRPVTGGSRDRAISISSRESESDYSSSDSSSDKDETAPRTKVPANSLPSRWQAAAAMIQKLPASPEVKKPASVGAKAVQSDDGQRKEQDNKEKTGPADKKQEQSAKHLGQAGTQTKEHEMESFEDSIGDIMAYRAEMERNAQQKREAEEELGRHAMPESESEIEEEPQPYTGSRPSIKTPRKAPAQKPKSVTVRGKPTQVGTARQLPGQFVASEDNQEVDDERIQARPAAKPRGRPPGSKDAQPRKRNAPDAVSSQAKKLKASSEQEQPAGLAPTANDNKHGLPPLQSPISSPNLKACLDSYGGDVKAFKAAAPTCAKVLSQETHVDDTNEPADKIPRPALKRNTPPPAPVTTANLRPERKKPLPEVVHDPIIDEANENVTVTKPTGKAPQPARKTSKQASSAVNAGAAPIQRHHGIIMVNDQIQTPPTDRGAGFLTLVEADEKLVLWRHMGLDWSRIRTLYANETGQILSVNTFRNRYKRFLERHPNIAAKAAKAFTNRYNGPPPDAPVPRAPAEKQGEETKPKLGGKTWNLDALEAWHANQRDIAAFLTDGEDEDEDEEMPDVDNNKELALHSRHEVRAPSPEPLDENECWYQYQVFRKTWKTKPPRASDTKHADADSGSDLDSNDEEEEDKIEVLIPETVVGRSYYHTLHEANAAAGQEMRGGRFGAAGIGPTGATGCLSFKYEAGPHGMINQEARFVDDVVVRVWVNRFVRAPGMARQNELQLENDPQKRQPDVGSAPHGWQAKMVWVTKRKQVEVRLTRKVRACDADADGEERADANANEDVMETEETKLLDIKDLGTYTVLDAANRDISVLALDFQHPSSNQSIDAIQARCEAKKLFQEAVTSYEASDTPFAVEFEGEEETLFEDGENEGVTTTKRVDTTFWVESSMLQGPRNI